jgi:hypothetical protein
MRILGLMAGLLILFAASPASAQGWQEYLSREDRFVQVFPGAPAIEETSWTDFNGNDRPARRYSGVRNGSTYSLTVVDFTEADYNTMRGAYAHAAYVYRKKGEVTYDAWAMIDRVDGHALQINLYDGNKMFFAAHMHQGRLYILECVMRPRDSAPVQFMQGMVFLDENGERVRYGTNGERVPRTDDLPDILGGADVTGPIFEGQSDIPIP